jgi:hypothetical protein
MCHTQTCSEAHLPSYLMGPIGDGGGAVSMGVKRPEHELYCHDAASISFMHSPHFVTLSKELSMAHTTTTATKHILLQDVVL